MADAAPYRAERDHSKVLTERAVARGLTVVGTMSGTSMDGIDLAVLTSDGERRLGGGPSTEIAYSAPQRKALECAVERATAMERSTRADFAEEEAGLTAWHADAVAHFIEREGVKPDLVALHGHTLMHRPDRGETLQIGDGEALARCLGVPVAWDFRSADMAAGGQGAPLVPVYHRALAEGLDAEGPLCFLNVGGVANVTYVDGDNLIAFDCGPGNMLIDRWLQREAGVPFDQGGRIAGEGRIARTYIEEVLARPFFDAPAPKSLDRFDFGLPATGAMDVSDGARTLTRLTAEAVAACVQLLPRAPRTWVVCGGGRLNDLIMSDLRDALHGNVEQAEHWSLDGGTMEAEAFAFLAVRTVRGLPLTWPTTTGCRSPSTGGLISWP